MSGDQEVPVIRIRTQEPPVIRDSGADASELRGEQETPGSGVAACL
jgi:hypothetical protein